MYGDVVELTGHTGSGKTELLYQIAAACILPKKWLAFEIQGRELAVVYFDLDFRFNVLRFMVVLEGWVRRKIAAAQDAGRRTNASAAHLEVKHPPTLLRFPSPPPS